MSFLKKLFGGKPPESPSPNQGGIATPDFPKQPNITPSSSISMIPPTPKKSATVDLSMVLELAKQIPDPDLISEGLTSITIPPGVGNDLIHAIDEVAEKAPDNVDLQLVKHSILRLMLRGDEASAALQKATSIDPYHMDVQFALDGKETWVMFPKWHSGISALPPAISHLIESKQLLLVRDGISLGLAVFNVVNPSEFPMGFPPNTPTKWEPIFSKTPYAPIIAHYSVFADNPTDPYRNEKFLNITTAESMSPMSGRKIIERLASLTGCYIVFTDGYRVLYNKFYTPDSRTRANWNKVAEQTASFTGIVEVSDFKTAYQWHMNNFNLGNIKI
jgi:hypothetical protein